MENEDIIINSMYLDIYNNWDIVMDVWDAYKNGDFVNNNDNTYRRYKTKKTRLIDYLEQEIIYISQYKNLDYNNITKDVFYDTYILKKI